MERAQHVLDHDLELVTLSIDDEGHLTADLGEMKIRPASTTSSSSADEREDFSPPAELIDGVYPSQHSLGIEGGVLMPAVPSSAAVEYDEATVRRMTHIWGRANLAIILGYFAVGFSLTFWVTPLQVYLVEGLNASSAKVNVLMTLLDLPWSFKVGYGLLSDCVPVRGKRRKPYYLLGWVIYLLANMLLALIGRPSMGEVLVLTFVAVIGYLMSDVMCDAMVVERARYEPHHLKGEMQAVGYVLRYAGNILGSSMGTVLYNKKQWGWGLDISQVFWLNAVLPAGLALAFAYQLEDPAHYSAGSLEAAKQLGKVWDMVQRRSIFLPMAAIAFYNVLQVPNAAWTNFLIAGLGFTPWALGLRLIAATVFSWLGAMFYRLCLRHYSWRATYTSTTIIVAAFSVLQLLLIFRINVRWGISDLLFSVGDDATSYFVRAAQWFPLVAMYIGLCPEGAEGVAFAMLTTFSNVAGTVGSNIGTLLTSLWDVSNDRLLAQDFTGLWKLTLLTSLLQPVGLALIWLLPRSPEHQKAMQKCQKRSLWGGVAFAGFLVCAWGWTVVETVVVMVKE